MALIDFTLSNARRFYSSMGSPLGLKGLSSIRNFKCISTKKIFLAIFFSSHARSSRWNFHWSFSHFQNQINWDLCFVVVVVVLVLFSLLQKYRFKDVNH